MLRGLLGWSNKRGGLELYRFDAKIIPRHGSEWGDVLLMPDEMKQHEGCPVILVVLDRKATEDDIAWAEDMIRTGLETP
jgi:hypothetical protein